MRTARVISWALGITALMVLIAAAVIYAMLCRIPAEYQYRPLPAEGQKEARNWLIADHIFDQFANKAGAGRPFTWTITAARLNDYLASIDEIASLSGQPTYPSAEMERAGFSGPAVAMRPGVLTLMILAKKYGKIVSVDVAFDFDRHGNLAAKTLAMRVGVMPVPKSFLTEVRQRARGELADHLARAEQVRDAHIGPVPVGRFARLMRNIVEMLDGRYVRPELPWQKHRVLAEQVDITPGKLAVHFVPAPRRIRPRATPTAPAAGGAERRPL